MDIRLDFGEQYGETEIPMDIKQFKYSIFLALKTLHGDMGCSIPFDILKYREKDRRAIIRFQSKHITAIWSALTLFSSYDDLECTFKVYKATPVLACLNLNSSIYNHKEQDKCMEK
ncbi:Ribonuclease P protein subunit p14 like protein [Argiope bruennichi]|uniref:Ribonuclease P protein subunit p14 like protein n=2 Tax=Argiope bruennichi TaxID=94029 RepID=A0A8T0E9E7_ARGBR|nr:Ribonuclease P protein subunit p14 like protein [Argiope bruennichi]